MNLLRQRTLHAPASAKPAAYRTGSYTKKTRPLGKAHRLATMFDDMASLFIEALFRQWNPLAVLWGVRAVVVNSLNRVLRGRLSPHVSEKVLECQPPVANANAPAAIRVVAIGARILAPINHPAPRRVFRDSPAVPTPPVSCRPTRKQLPVEASATLGVTADERTTIDYLLFPALTLTQPRHLVGKLNLCLRNGREAAKDLPGNVFARTTPWSTIAVSHNFLLVRNCGQGRRCVTSATSPRLFGGTSILAMQLSEAT
jgi:hypothetical protein